MLQWGRALTSAEIRPSQVFDFQRSPRRSASAPSRSTLREEAVPRLVEKIQHLQASSRLERLTDFRRHVTARSAQRVFKSSVMPRPLVIAHLVAGEVGISHRSVLFALGCPKLPQPEMRTVAQRHRATFRQDRLCELDLEAVAGLYRVVFAVAAE